MRKLLISFLLVLVCSVLVGCEKNTFNRKDAFNQYAWVSDVLYVPFNKNIVVQTIEITEMKPDGSATSLTEIMTDRAGHIIRQNYLFGRNVINIRMDYDDLKFNYEVNIKPYIFIDIKNGDFSLNADGNVTKLKSANNIMKNGYDAEGQLSYFSLDFKDPFWDDKSNYFWNNNLITKADCFFKSAALSYKISTNYYYDSLGRVTGSKTFLISKQTGIKEIFNLITVTEYNQNGDWIKAEIEHQDGKKELMIRKIQYR